MSREYIENLVYGYARLLDQGDLEAVAELFRHGKICAPEGEPATGYEQVLSLYRNSTRIYPDGTPATRHLTTNLNITLDQERAQAHSYFTVMQALPDFPLQPIISGTYEDKFQKIDGEWYFFSRTMYPQLLGDLSRHLLFDASTLR